MSSTLFKTTYSLREDIFQKLERREKSLLKRDKRWLVAQTKKNDLGGNLRQTKGHLALLLMTHQNGLGIMAAYWNVKTQRHQAKFKASKLKK